MRFQCIINIWFQRTGRFTFMSFNLAPRMQTSIRVLPFPLLHSRVPFRSQSYRVRSSLCYHRWVFGDWNQNSCQICIYEQTTVDSTLKSKGWCQLSNNMEAMLRDRRRSTMSKPQDPFISYPIAKEIEKRLSQYLPGGLSACLYFMLPLYAALLGKRVGVFPLLPTSTGSGTRRTLVWELGYRGQSTKPSCQWKMCNMNIQCNWVLCLICGTWQGGPGLSFWKLGMYNN